MNLVVREFINGETVYGLVLVVEPVGKDIGESERDEENRGKYVY